MRLGTWRLTVGVLLSFMLASPIAASAAATAGRGWQTHVISSGGFRLDTPAAWTDIVNSPPQKLAALKADYPWILSAAESAKRNPSIKFAALDSSGSSTSVNIIAAPMGGATLQTFVASNVRSLEQSPALSGRLTVSPITLPAIGRTYSVTFKENLGNGLTSAHVIYYLVHDGNGYGLGFTTQSQLFARSKATFLRVARSLKFS